MSTSKEGRSAEETGPLPRAKGLVWQVKQTTDLAPRGYRPRLLLPNATFPFKDFGQEDVSFDEPREAMPGGLKVSHVYSSASCPPNCSHVVFCVVCLGISTLIYSVMVFVPPPLPLSSKRPCLVSGGGGAREPSPSIFQIFLEG